MAEKSFPWTSNGTGDGTSGGYTALEWSEMWRRVFLAGLEANRGVLPSIGNELAVSGTSSPVSVDTGAAFVYGKFYHNTAAVSLTVSTPAIGTTGGHVILRLDWSAQTVRLVAVRNSDGVNSTPSLTQSVSTQWEIRLATFTITTGGVITLTDSRVYVRYSSNVLFTNIDGGTSTRIPFFGSSGSLGSSGDLTFTDSSDTLTIGTDFTITRVGTTNTRIYQTPSAGAALLDLDANAPSGSNATVRIGRHTSNGAGNSRLVMYLNDGSATETIALSGSSGVITITPQSATAPIILGANGQDQLVTGLNADSVDGVDIGTMAATRIPFASSADALASSANLTFNNATNTLTIGTDFTITRAGTTNTRIYQTPSAGAALLDLDADAPSGSAATVRIGRHTSNGASDSRLVVYLNDGSATETIALSGRDGVVTITPQSATAPIILGANGQGQRVNGLHADEIDTLGIRRQGGDATNWNTAGTTTYTPADMRMQFGVRSLSTTTDAGGDSVTITFPVAFSAIPHIIVSPFSTSGEKLILTVTAITTTTFDVRVDYTTTGTAPDTVNIHWEAKGPR